MMKPQMMNGLHRGLETTCHSDRNRTIVLQDRRVRPGLDVCPLARRDIKSLDFVVNNLFMKVWKFVEICLTLNFTLCYILGNF